MNLNRKVFVFVNRPRPMLIVALALVANTACPTPTPYHPVYGDAGDAAEDSAAVGSASGAGGHAGAGAALGTGGIAILVGSGGIVGSSTQDGGVLATPDAPVDGPLLPRELAAACSDKANCASGNCVDGVCCDATCADSCSACNVNAFEGHCTPVPVGSVAPSPHPACPKMAATTCKQNGVCDGKGACQLYPSGEACSAGTCSAATQVSVTGSTCDGLGTCKPAPVVACLPFKCKADGTACATTCAADSDCQGQPCVAGSCGKVADGSKCTAPGQCVSGNCVDGYCCDVACAGSCQACDLAGSIGKCTSLPANQTPRNGRTSCVSGTCGSRCDGTSASCVFASKTTSDPGCVASKCQVGTCNGTGACAPAADGAMCGTNMYCLAGTCRACVPNQACTTVNPCKTGTTSCATGSMMCLETGNKPPNTTCGAGSSCSGTTKTNATVCNASGVCAAPATQSCANGCNAAKTDCLTCPSGQTACGGSCFDTTSNAAHCGPGCTACGSDAPICLNSACVQCASDASCAGTNRPSCDMSTHKCVCRRKSAGNLLMNPGFDTMAQVVPSWIDADEILGQVWSAEDSDGCPESGSIFGSIYAISPCVTVSPGVLYHFGLRSKSATASDPMLQCYLIAFPEPGCPSQVGVSLSPTLTPGPSPSWKTASSSWIIPPLYVAATLRCTGTYGLNAYIDQAYLNSATDAF